MNLDDFIKKYTGVKNVGNTNENRGECVGLVAVYVDELKLSHIWGNGCDLYINASDKEWTKILNTPLNIPQKGDVIVWKKTSSNPYGHTGIFTSGNVLYFNSFDQNLPTGSTPHIQAHTYLNVLGFLRPKDPTGAILELVRGILNANLSNKDKIKRLREVLA